MHRNLPLGVLGALVVAAVAAACGSSAGGGTPECPSYPPAAGDACPADGQTCGWSDECQWRGSATCVAGVWQLKSWYDPEGQWDCGCDGSCLPCPAEAPADGSACDGTHQRDACTYPNPTCAKGTITALCNGSNWRIGEDAPSCQPSCPATLPTAGAACESCCLAKDCADLDGSGCPARLACESGAWVVTPSSCTPTSACAGKGLADCAAAAGCRWLSHASCPSYPESYAQGCYLDTVCDSDQDCPAGSHCNYLEFDPCPSGECAACVANTMACIP
jgi:hypothetical protein